MTWRTMSAYKSSRSLAVSPLVSIGRWFVLTTLFKSAIRDIGVMVTPFTLCERVHDREPSCDKQKVAKGVTVKALSAP